MIKYLTQYSYSSGNQIIALVIFAEITNDEELIQVCDTIFEKYTTEFNEIKIYFFKNKDNANRFTYLKFLLGKDETEAMEKSNITGYLKGSELTSRQSPPHLIKTYKNPKV